MSGKPPDLTGQRFGELTALELVPGADKFNRRLWRCRCDCGGECVVATNSLRSTNGGRKSCGCRGTGPGPLPPGITERNAILCQMKSGARKRGYSWTITDEQVFALLGGSCHWCGSPPSNTKHLRGTRVKPRAPFVYSGVDRVDNSRGYEPDNIVSCCAVCNWMKRHLTPLAFLQHAARITQKWAGKVLPGLVRRRAAERALFLEAS